MSWNNGESTMSARIAGAVAAAVGDDDGAARSEEALRQQTLNQFDEAMNAVPTKDKQAYLEARAQAPGLVSTETDPLQFVRVCDYNFWNATSRMCAYWRARKKYFQERAFLPLTLNERGALNEADILTLQGGFPAILPNTKDGTQVMFWDRTQWLSSTSRENRARAIFYVVKKTAQDLRAQTDGVLCLLLFLQPRVRATDNTLRNEIWDLVETAFPLKVRFHLLNILPKTLRGIVPSFDGAPAMSKQSFIQRIVTKAKERTDKNWFFRKIEVHFEHNDGELRQQMMNLGLERDGIPTCIGGDWSYARSMRWCEAQAIEEIGESAHLTHACLSFSTELQSAATRKKATATQQKDDKRVETSKDLTASQKRRKLANVIHSRNKREKKKKELETLKEEAERLATCDRALKAEYERLCMLLNEAHGVLSDPKNLEYQEECFAPKYPASDASNHCSRVFSSSSAAIPQSHFTAGTGYKEPCNGETSQLNNALWMGQSSPSSPGEASAQREHDFLDEKPPAVESTGNQGRASSETTRGMGSTLETLGRPFDTAAGAESGQHQLGLDFAAMEEAGDLEPLPLADNNFNTRGDDPLLNRPVFNLQEDHLHRGTANLSSTVNQQHTFGNSSMQVRARNQFGAQQIAGHNFSVNNDRIPMVGNNGNRSAQFLAQPHQVHAHPESGSNPPLPSTDPPLPSSSVGFTEPSSQPYFQLQNMNQVDKFPNELSQSSRHCSSVHQLNHCSPTNSLVQIPAYGNTANCMQSLDSSNQRVFLNENVADSRIGPTRAEAHVPTAPNTTTGDTSNFSNLASAVLGASPEARQQLLMLLMRSRQVEERANR